MAEADSGFVIRRASPGDFATLFSLEQQAHSHPWTQQVFENMMAASHVRCEIIENEKQVVLGFAFVQMAGDEATLLDIVVDPACQGRGVGRYLLNDLIERLIQGDVVQTLFLEVRVSNFAAISLYFSCGFTEVGQRRDYYPAPCGTREDALIMALPLKAVV